MITLFVIVARGKSKGNDIRNTIDANSGASPHVGTDPVSVRLHANSVYRPHAISGIIDTNIHPVLTGGADRRGVCPYMRANARVWVHACGDTANCRLKIVRLLSGNSFLIFSYLASRKDTKNGTENPLGIPVCIGCAALFARAYEKAN